LNDIEKQIDRLVEDIRKLEPSEKRTAIVYLILNSVANSSLYESLGFLEFAKHFLLTREITGRPIKLNYVR